MKIPHEKFCVLPWVSLETSPIGSVRPCCLADDELRTDDGVKFDLNTANFADIQNCQDMKVLRQEFLQGKQPSTCRKCWNEEDSHRTSKRMHTLNRLKHMISDEEWTEESKPLMFLDLKLGNICNLKCRICGSWSSSAFATEELKALPEGVDPKTSMHYRMVKAGAWPRNNPIFWNEIENTVDDLRYIEFTGGEPFMIQEHFDLLRKLIDKGISQNIEIHYNTNGTQWPEFAEDIWKNFKHVEVAFSIDDVGARFEYQRSNAKWDEVQSNIAKFVAMRDRNSNITLQVCTTINIFNVYYLETVAQWIEQQSFDYVYWNMMHDPYYYSIATLPALTKIAIANKLRTAQVSEQTKNEFKMLIDFMNNGPNSDGNKLREQIALLDKRRNEDLRIVAPELARLIDL